LSDITFGDIEVAVATRPTVVLLTAPAWCVPCRRFHPHWVKAQEHFPNAVFLEIDMGETPELTSEHWAYTKFDVRSVPTVLAFQRIHATGFESKRIEARAVVPFIKELGEFFA
jgi:thiol-disulfide isomerase/thioredoxin